MVTAKTVLKQHVTYAIDSGVGLTRQIGFLQLQ
jgi:hypothetical protein